MRAGATGAALLAVAVLAGCAAALPEPVAAEATAVSAGRAGFHLRWRGGADPSVTEDRHVRELLAEPLTERAAVEVAIVRSRRLQAAVERAIAAALAAEGEAAPGNPVADLVLRWPRGGGGPVVDAGIAVALLDLLRLPARRDGARLAARDAALEAAEEIVDGIREVREAWVDAVAARERAAVDATVAEAAAVAADLAGRQQDAGTLAALDANRHRVFRDEALVALERSRLEAAATAERLVRSLGLHGAEARVRLPDALPEPPPGDAARGDAEATAVTRRLDLERARVRVLSSRLEAGLAANERILPDLEAGVSHERESGGERSTGPSVAVVLPLGGREAAHAASAAAAAREAEDALYDLAVRVRSEAREAVAGLASARAVAERLRVDVLPRRAAMVEEAQRHYNGMLIGVYDLLAEKREELHARRESAQAVRDWWLARLRLDAAVGGGLAIAEHAAPPPADSAETTEDDDPHAGHRHGGER